MVALVNARVARAAEAGVSDGVEFSPGSSTAKPH
jgi:hypothetical protein